MYVGLPPAPMPVDSSLQIDSAPGLFLEDVPVEQQVANQQILADLLHLKGLAPGGYNDPLTPQALLDLIFNTDLLSLGEPTCITGCSTKTQCAAKAGCMLCHSCRSEWRNRVLQRVMAEHLSECSYSRLEAAG